MRGNPRRMTRRRLVLLSVLAVTLLTLVSMTASMAQPETAVTLRVVGPANPVPAGQQFSVQVRVEGASNLGAFEFQYVFNSNIASTTVNDIQLASFLGSTGRSTGQLRLASAPTAPHQPLYGAYSYGSASGPSGNGQLATITMRATRPGTTALTVQDVQVTNVSGTPVQATVVAGSVQVVASTNNRFMYLPVLMHNQ